MKQIYRIFLAACFLGSPVVPVCAQSGHAGSVVVSEPTDPISDMLDSLVSLNFLNRAGVCSNSATTPCDFSKYRFQPQPDEYYHARLARLQTPIPLDYNNDVRKYIELYLKRPQLTSRVMGLAQLYFPMFEQVFDQQGLPLEFKYLAVVESALNPVAVSKAGATGIWQFMYNTGKMYGLNVTSYIDERRDPYKATYAACQYFKDMYKIYNDWLLVIAAYNCGPRNVNKAIARSGGKTTFWEIKRFLPTETQGYVPAFIAVNFVMNYAAEHNIPATPPFISYFEVDTVSVNQRVSFQQISSIIDIPVDILTYLNPSFKRGFVPYIDQPLTLRMPSGKIAQFIAKSESIYSQQSTSLSNPAIPQPQFVRYEYVTQKVKKVHTVRRGETLSLICRKYGCSLENIRKWNKLKSNMLRTGQTLAVFVSETEKVEVRIPVAEPNPVKKNTLQSDTTFVSAGEPVAPVQERAQKTNESRFIYHTVQPGDTLWNIAQRYQGVTVQQLKSINNITDNGGLKVGSKIKVAFGG